jgi:hypothetical protein
VEGSSQATAASTEREKMDKKSLAEFFDDISISVNKKVYNRLIGCSSKVVDPSPFKMGRGSSPALVDSTEREKMEKNVSHNFLMIENYFCL